MIRKRIKTATVIFALFFGIIEILLLCAGLKIWIILLLFFTLSLIFIIVSAVIALKKLNKILNDKCDPYEYLNEYIEFYNFEKYPKRYKMPLHILNISNAYLCMDNTDKIKETLESFDINKAKNANHRAAYYMILKAMAFRASDLFAVGEYNDLLEKAIVDIKNQKLMQNAFESVESTREILRMDFGAIRKRALKKYEDKNQNKHIRVLSLHGLALIDMAEKKHDEARGKFEKVIKHGNRLYVVMEAKKMLTKISEEQPPNTAITSDS